MKKYSLLIAAAALLALVACEGDTPSEPGTLPTVTGLEIDTTTTEGRSIVLNWDEVTGETVEGYEVYFSTSGSSWSALGTVTGTTYTDEADEAGYYSVRAYEGDNYSESYASSVNTLPETVSDTFTIVDQYGTATLPSGFYFGYFEGGSWGGYGTVMVTQSTDYDIYAYDDQQDPNVALFRSGDYGGSPYGQGFDSDFSESGSGYPSGTWSPSYTSTLSDGGVVFVRLNGFTDHTYYAKVTIVDVYPDEATPNGTKVDFTFEFQTLGDVYVFNAD